MAKQDEKLQAYEELTTQMNASTVTLDADKRQKLHEILHQKPEFAQLLEKFKALCSDDETRKAISEVCPASEADDHFDFKAMLQSMGAYCKIDPDKDGYVFNWPGKQTAIQLANEPTENTLIPDKADSRDWNTTQNIYIEGDNLEALKCLRNAYAGKIKMIYIDPPYNADAMTPYCDYFRGKKVSSDDAGKHTKWLNMLYPRLMLARELMSEDGVIFISIDEREFGNLKKLSDAIFGEVNYIGNFPRVTKKGGKSSTSIAKNHDFILVYKKYEDSLNGVCHSDDGYCNKDEFFDERGFYKLNQTLDYDSLGWVQSLDYPIQIGNETFYAGGSYDEYVNRKNGNHGRADWGWRWRWSKELFEFGYSNGFIEIKRGGERPRIYTKTYQNVKISKTKPYEIINIDRMKSLSTLEFTDNSYSNDNAKKEFDKVFENQNGVFEHPKGTTMIKRIMNLYDNKNYIVLDFFSGSATTAHAVMQLNAEDGGNRKFIMVQLQETASSEAIKAGYKNICEIGKERIRRAGDKIKADNPLTTKDLDIGFRVFRVGKSNIPKWWRYDGTEKNIEMFDAPQNKRTDEDKYRAIAYEFMLKHKCMLDARVDEYLTPEQMAKTGGKPLFVVDGALFICPVGGVNAAWAASVVAMRRTRYAMTSNDAWFVAVNDTLGDSSDNRDSDKLLAVKTLVEAGLPAKHFLHI